MSFENFNPFSKISNENDLCYIDIPMLRSWNIFFAALITNSTPCDEGNGTKTIYKRTAALRGRNKASMCDDISFTLSATRRNLVTGIWDF